VDGLYEENRSESSQLGYSLKNDLVNTECIKLALNMMRSQFSELSADETDTNSSYLMDWVTLALSPIGK
jgi:hypothetical protein